MASILRGNRAVLRQLSGRSIGSNKMLHLISTRLLSTQKPSDFNSAEKEQSLKKTTQNEETELSEFMKFIHKSDHRPPIKYRRQNYNNPIERACGIIADDFRIMYSNVRYVLRGCYRIINGCDPETGDKIKTTVEQSDDSKDSKLQTETKTSNTKHDVEVTNLQETNEMTKEKKTNVNKGSVKNLISRLTPPVEQEIWPGHCDILIIGGGAVGSSIAYHLKERATDGLSVVVVEKDPTYHQSSTVLSVGGIRHQFSLPENVLLSMYGMEFMRDMPRLLSIDGTPPPSVNFQPHGYLTLASDKGIHQLHENLYVQQHFNARVKYLEPSALKAAFPWMNCEGLAGGVMGMENEGWFDPWSLLMALRGKAISLGVQYVNAEMTGVQFAPKMDTFVDGYHCTTEKRVQYVTVRLPDGEERTITTAGLVMATGHATGDLCYNLMGIGKAKEGLMAYPVPIEPRKRYVYSFHAPKGPGLATPLVVDPSGAYFRREGLGNMFLSGMSPPEHLEPACTDLEVDHEYFEREIWPILANRVPTFEELKVQGSWAGFYEYNVFDQNGIVGLHPVIANLILAAGFSGHGIQHSLGVGRGVMELLLYNKYKTIDMSRLHMERIQMNEPMYEAGIV